MYLGSEVEIGSEIQNRKSVGGIRNYFSAKTSFFPVLFSDFEKGLETPPTSNRFGRSRAGLSKKGPVGHSPKRGLISVKFLVKIQFEFTQNWITVCKFMQIFLGMVC